MSTLNLNHRVTLRERAAGAGPLGQGSSTWTDIDSVWSKVEPLRGREWFAAGQMQASADVRITIRFRADVVGRANLQVGLGDIKHDVVGPPIDVGGRHEFLELMCATGVRDGR